MYQVISEYNFIDAFESIRPNNFSYEGLLALYEYLTEYEEDIYGEKGMELDVIAICCEYTEYENIKELQKDYPDIESIEELENETTVIKINDDSFIIQQY